MLELDIVVLKEVTKAEIREVNTDFGNSSCLFPRKLGWLVDQHPGGKDYVLGICSYEVVNAVCMNFFPCEQLTDLHKPDQILHHQH